jgi:hypothetical protein
VPYPVFSIPTYGAHISVVHSRWEQPQHPRLAHRVTWRLPDGYAVCGPSLPQTPLLQRRQGLHPALYAPRTSRTF